MRPPALDETFSDKAIEALIKQGEMTVPFKYQGHDFGLVTVVADRTGLRVVDLGSQDAALRNMIIGMYIFRF